MQRTRSRSSTDRRRPLDIQVPQDLSVTGFDDLAEAENTRPGLTTVRQPIETKGRLAADYLVEAITADQQTPTARQMRLHTVLLLRGSTAPPPAR